MQQYGINRIYKYTNRIISCQSNTVSSAMCVPSLGAVVMAACDSTSIGLNLYPLDRVWEPLSKRNRRREKM